MSKQDYYKILGVSRDATADHIRKAYRKLARKYHPDFNEGDKAAESRFKEISEAYAVLSNPEAKQKFDQFGHSGGPNFQGFDFSGFDFSNLSGSFSGGGQTYNSGGFDINDLFGGLFGQRGRRASGFGSRPSKGQSLQYIMDIRFEDAALGSTTQITVDTGAGQKTLKVRIPAGLDHGQTIRVKGKGAPSPNGGPPGDLLIQARIKPHPEFSRKGLDLYCKTSITIGKAALGGPMSVPTIDGQAVTMTVPAGTQGGQRFRLQGRGIREAKGRQGDLYCTVQIAVPKNLDEESKKLIEQFEERTGSQNAT